MHLENRVGSTNPNHEKHEISRGDRGGGRGSSHHGLSSSLGGSLTGGGKLQIADRFQRWQRGNMKLKAIIHEAEEGGFWAEVPALPGCFTQGESLEELEANIAEAIEAYQEA